MELNVRTRLVRFEANGKISLIYERTPNMIRTFNDNARQMEGNMKRRLPIALGILTGTIFPVILSGCSFEKKPATTSVVESDGIGAELSGTGTAEPPISDEVDESVRPLAESGDYRSVISALETRDPNSLSNTEKNWLASAYANVGTYEYREKEYSDKTRKLIESVSGYESDAELLFTYGYAFEIVKSYDRAFETYEKVLELVKDSPPFAARAYRQM